MNNIKAFLYLTYLIFTFAFKVLSLEGTLVALDISGLYNAVICAKFTFGSRVQ